MDNLIWRRIVREASFKAPKVLNIQCVYLGITVYLTTNLRQVWSSIESFPSASSKGPTLEQYRTLTSQFNEIKRENAELIRNNQVLTTKLDTLEYVISTTDIIAQLTTKLRKAYETLANRLPQLVDMKTIPQEMHEANPNVRYWTRQEWTAATADRVADFEEAGQSGARGRTRAAQGINVNMRYIEDRNGQPINGHLASDIRRHARAIFVGFALEGRLFSSWTEADHTSLKAYYREMAERFEELRLCANDWKAEMVALDIYRTWRDQWQKKKNKTKTGKDTKTEHFEGDKDCEEFDADDDNNISVKHGIDRTAPEDGRPPKKIKSDNSTPDPAVLTGYVVPPQMARLRIFRYNC